MDSAASRTLRIAELLEAILLQLPCRDLLLSQKVSHAWKNVIEESVSIQTALCFRPTTCTITASEERTVPCDPKLVIYHTGQDFLDAVSERQPGDKPLLNPFFDILFPASNIGDGHRYIYHDFTSPLPTLGYREHNGITASWQSMLLTQPAAPSLKAPRTLLELRNRGSVTMADGHYERTLFLRQDIIDRAGPRPESIRTEGGVTVADLLKYMEGWLKVENLATGRNEDLRVRKVAFTWPAWREGDYAAWYRG